MNIPSAVELHRRDDLVPIGEICDHLVECLNATARHQRKSTVVVTYEIEYDDEEDRMTLFVKTKSKRPVRTSRNEEIIGDRNSIFSLTQDVEGQERIPGTDGITGVTGFTLTAGARGVNIGTDY